MVDIINKDGVPSARLLFVPIISPGLKPRATRINSRWLLLKRPSTLKDSPGKLTSKTHFSRYVVKECALRTAIFPVWSL